MATVEGEQAAKERVRMARQQRPLKLHAQFSWMDSGSLRFDTFDPIEEEQEATLADRRDSSPNGQPGAKSSRKFECAPCEKVYTERRTLTRHFTTPEHCIKLGLPVASHACSYCRRTYTRDDHRKRHEQEVHLQIKRRRPPRQRSAREGQPRYRDAGDAERPNQHADSSSPPDLWSIYAELEDTSRAAKVTRTMAPFNEPEQCSSGTQQRLLSSEAMEHSEVSISSSETLRNDSRSASVHDSGCEIVVSGSVMAAEKTTDPIEPRDTDSASVRSNSTIGSLRTVLQRPITALNRPREALVRSGASARPRTRGRGELCVLCRRRFGRTGEEVRAHLHAHFLEFTSQHLCGVCRIGFAHETDLRWHQRCANGGHCGFEFKHNESCQGHHAPSTGIDSLSDNDRMRLCVGLRHWEQAQLRSYMSDVDDVLRELPPTSEDCWSVGAICRRSLASVSIIFSRLDLNSAPDCLEHQEAPSPRSPKKDTGPMTNKSKRTLYQGTRQASKAYRLVAAAGESDAQLDNLLSAAATCGNVSEAKRLLWAGADVNGRRSSFVATPATLAACSGHVGMLALLFDYGGNLTHPVFVEQSCLSSLANDHDRPLVVAYSRAPDFNCKERSYVVADALAREQPSIEVSCVYSERNEGLVELMQCTLAIDRGDDDEDYLIVPRSVVCQFSMEDLPAGIALCHAIECGHTEVAVLLCQKSGIGRNAIAVRLAADQSRHELLSKMLRTSQLASEAVKADASILRSAAFGKCDDTVDVLLQYSSNQGIRAVLRDAVARERPDVVTLICSKTVAFVDPLDRRFDCRLPFRWTNVDAAAVKTAIDTCNQNGRRIDYARTFLLLATTDPEQRVHVRQVLYDGGVELDTIFWAARVIENYEHRELLSLFKTGTEEEVEPFLNSEEQLRVCPAL